MVTLKKRGFTLVELLTVVAIIALLIGILVPAVNQARKSAVKVSVRAQLSGISQGIEMFRSDYGYYPSSLPQDDAGADMAADRSGSIPEVQGSHRLAFALLGRDQQGCPAKRVGNYGPDSIHGFYYTSGPGTNDRGLLKASVTGVYFPEATATYWGNVDYKTARKGPYIDPKGFGIVRDQSFDIDEGILLLNDKYDKQPQNDITDVKNYSQHSPILYYAANERGNRLYAGASYATSNNSIYYWQDNNRILSPASGDPALFSGGYNAENFFKFVEDDKALVGTAAAGTHRPYNPESFLLISRGYDGIYGTGDDVTNWGD